MNRNTHEDVFQNNAFQELSESTIGQALHEGQISVVDFWAPWCVPCRAMGTILDRAAPKFSGRIAFFKVNVDSEPSLARRFGVVSIPTVMAFRGTTPLGRFEGKTAEREVQTWLESLLK